MPTSIEPTTVTAVPAACAAAEMPAIKLGSDVTLALQKSHGSWASGLCETLARSIAAHPQRIVVLDNSGSMGENDGRRLVWHGGTFKTLPCSRWAELAEDAVEIAKLSEVVNARTDFHLLNPQPGFRAVTVRPKSWSGGIEPLGHEVDAEQLKGMLQRTHPNGTTPLTEAVMKIASMLDPHAARMRADGQSVAVLICTDGLPNDKKSFVQAMRLLQTLPVWCVVRLCTDDDSVVEYWNDLDRALEAPLEVLDDVRGEAQEVYSLNPWLTYGPPLHAARLFGLPEKLFDALDEHRLVPSQIKAFCELLFGLADLPEPELDRPGFLEAVRTALLEQPATYDPRQGKMLPWVDMRALERALLSSQTCDEKNVCRVM